MKYLPTLPDSTGLLEDVPPILVMKSRDYSRVRIVLILVLLSSSWFLIDHLSFLDRLNLIVLTIFFISAFLISYDKYYIVRINDRELILQKIYSWWLHFQTKEVTIGEPSVQIYRYSRKLSGPSTIKIISSTNDVLIKTSNQNASNFMELIEISDFSVEEENRVGKKN